VTHPDDLLADYVDGTLDEPRRADVDAHLLGCARCREEVRLAGAAKVALAELDDLPVPFGVTGPVLVEAGRRFERRGRAWERLRWAGGLAAAAVLVLAVVLNVGRGDDRNAAMEAAATGAAGATAQAGGAGGAAAPVPFMGVERQPNVDYDEDGIRAVAAGAGGEIVAAEKAGEPGEALSAPSADATRTTFASAADSRHCIQQSGLPTNSPRDVLIRMIQARFEGTPAYIAVFAESPGAGQPADHVVVWVVSTRDCRILTTASQRLPQG
jgi:anti-sigma factor RsiW